MSDSTVDVVKNKYTVHRLPWTALNSGSDRFLLIRQFQLSVHILTYIHTTIIIAKASLLCGYPKKFTILLN